MSVALDGVYRRGEIYMRWLQSVSSLAFGTAVGRFLTLFLILPFGGAFVVLKACQELIHLYHKYIVRGGEHAHETELEGQIMSPYAMLGLGVVLFGLFHVPFFRRAVGHGLRLIWLVLRGVFYDIPRAVIHLTSMDQLFASPPLRFFYRFLLTPVAIAAVTWPGLILSGLDPLTSAVTAVAVFLAALVVLNSRIGRDVEELAIDWVLRGLDRIRVGILPGIFHFVMDLFKRMLEVVERLLYSVDEWLRFKSGESRFTLVAKAIVGTIWFFLTYLIRIYVNLLIEPTVNPIKHFPVVTVGHKIMAPLIPQVYFFFENLFLPMGRVFAIPAAVVTTFFVPGIFGFIVWELKENWRLYRANRSRTLGQALIGHHGETMIRLMRPGIHSGTLPKLFARLRKAERGGHRTGNWRNVHKHLDALHHVEECIRSFVDRELIAVLECSNGWRPLHARRGKIVLGSNRISVELLCADLCKGAVWISFEVRSDWLVAGIQEAGWLDQLSAIQAQVLATALAGLYKRAGVDFVREQIESCFTDVEVAYDIYAHGLIVWQERDFAAEAYYDFRSKEALKPRDRHGSPANDFPTLTCARVMFGAVPVFWEAWVDAWQQDQDKAFPLKNVADGVRLLPSASKKTAALS